MCMCYSQTVLMSMKIDAVTVAWDDCKQKGLFADMVVYLVISFDKSTEIQFTEQKLINSLITFVWGISTKVC